MEKQPKPQKTEKNEDKNSLGRAIAKGAMIGVGFAVASGGAHAAEHALESHNNAWKQKGMAEVYTAQGDAENAHIFNEAARANMKNSLANGALAAGEIAAAVGLGVAASRRRPEDEPHPEAPSATSVPTDLLPRE